MIYRLANVAKCLESAVEHNFSSNTCLKLAAMLADLTAISHESQRHQITH